MAKQLVAVYDDTMYMFADKKLDELREDDKCVVYNKDTNEVAPELCIGSWTCRVNPWFEPTEDQIEEAKEWMLKL